MENESPSIYKAFERMWEHILSKFSNYVPTSGGTMENTLTLNGIIFTEGIDYGSGDPADGVPGQLYFKKVT